MTRTRTLSLLLTMLCATLLAGVLAVARPASAEPVSADPTQAARVDPARLPAPTGDHEVSTRTLHLTDRHRRDPWVGGPRHLMVTMTYPTWGSSGQEARYMTPRESRALIEFQEGRGLPVPPEFPREVVSRTDVGASSGAPVRPRLGGRPLVLLSPGFSQPRSALTALATELASRGYVVAQVSHAHEDSGTELPSGRLLRCAACETEEYATIPRVRSRDLSQVLDHLLAWGNGWRAVLDPDRVGAAGHSIGGNASVTLAAEDRRVDAAVNMDGTMFDPVRRDLETPVMLFGTAQLHQPGGEENKTWLKTWRRLTGERTWLTVAGSNHGSFTDFPLLTEQLLGLSDPLPGERATEITRAYVSAFLDKHLRGLDSPLLEGPVEEFAEVAHHSP